MKRALIAVCFCILWLSDIMAQEIVTGTVVDSKNEPVPGVRVEIVGRTETTTTDIDGKFRIELPSPAKKIRFTYLGYKPIEKSIKPEMFVKLGHGWGGTTSGYRGFFEFTGGVGFGGKVSVYAGDCAVTDIGSPIVFGWNMTHGYQINRNLFAGLGFGMHASMLYGVEHNRYSSYDRRYAEHKFSTLNIPIYANARWDFGLEKKTAPFVDLKLGYTLSFAFDSDEDMFYSYSYDNDLYVYDKNTGGFLLMPTIGMRTTIRNKVGFNIGLSYNVMFHKKMHAQLKSSEVDFNGNYKSYEEVMDLGNSTGGVLMLNFGFDF